MKEVLVLTNMGREGQTILDTSSGSFEQHDTERGHPVGVCSDCLPSGSGASFGAIYWQTENLIFRLDERIWIIDEETEIHSEERLMGLRRIFILAKGQKYLLKRSYWNPRFSRPINLLDVVYDEFDKEADDFFYYLARNLNRGKSRDELAKRWGDA